MPTSTKHDSAFDPGGMGDLYLINFLITMDKLARHAQTIQPIKSGDTVKVASNMPTSPFYAHYRYHLPDDYWAALAEAQKRELI